MDTLKIVASGSNEKARAYARGKLFEQIASEVLRHHGYEIDRHQFNVVHAGMEIDIEGSARIARVPLYAECKCYSSNVDSEKLQIFYGKYMTRWFLNNMCHGLFLAIPGVNSPAMGFYRENCENNSQITIRLLQEPEVMDALLATGKAVEYSTFQHHILLDRGTSGDRVLVCSDKGFFWLQYIVPSGSGIASLIQIFDSLGHPVTDQATVDYLADLLPEIHQFEIIVSPKETIHHVQPRGELIDEVVELRGSSSCFEYQFPAAPEFFVGRESLLNNVEVFSKNVVDKNTSCRGVLFEANSGWGKSSLVLATLDRLSQLGHYAISFDSRSASTSQFVIRAIEYVLDKFGDFDGQMPSRPVLGGFEGASEALITIGQQLEAVDKILFIFFDQFENIFYLLDVLTRIAQLSLKVSDASTNVVLGFSWKTDLVGLTRDFPYRWRDSIIESCEVFHLPQFSEVETKALLDRLALELHKNLRRDLRFLLSEFSQGYPWLLKKLCAHVKSQLQAGTPQAEMVRGLLNVEQLFLDDLQGLTLEQEEALKLIARLAPVSIRDLGEEFSTQLVQSLVDRRLIVKVGTKYDVYWDIFRDYLNTGKLPIEEVYLLRAQVGSILKALTILQQSRGKLKTTTFKRHAMLSDGTFMNVARDLRLLHLAQIDDDWMSLTLPEATDEEGLLANLRDHLQDRLPRNSCVYRVQRVLREQNEVSISELALILKNEFPYISAVEQTWKLYARILAVWLDLADLAVLDDTKTKLSKYEVGAQVRDRTLYFARRRSGVTVPLVHFAPVVQVAKRVVLAVQKNEPVDWSGISRSTIYKSLSMLEEMKLISRQSQTIFVTPDCHAFANDPERRLDIARYSALNWPVFSHFVTILMENSAKRLSHKKLAQLLQEKCWLNWRSSTAETNVKIMLDWVRHLKLTVGVYEQSYRGRFKKPAHQTDMPLFDSLSKV
jgi:Fe2+ or Zn2+ uptake regulation protein